MAETSELTAADQDTAQDLAETIEELEQYRERLLHDTLEIAQRAKVMKSKALNQLNPDLEKIDAILQELRNRQAALTTSESSQ